MTVSNLAARIDEAAWDPMTAVVIDDGNPDDCLIDEALSQPTLTAQARAWLIEFRALSIDERWEVLELADAAPAAAHDCGDGA